MSGGTEHDETVATHAGRNPPNNYGIINPPVYRASTVLFPTMETFDGRGPGRMEPGNMVFGLNGTPTTFALEQSMIALEGMQIFAMDASGVGFERLLIPAYLGRCASNSVTRMQMSTMPASQTFAAWPHASHPTTRRS